MSDVEQRTHEVVDSASVGKASVDSAETNTDQAGGAAKIKNGREERKKKVSTLTVIAEERKKSPNAPSKSHIRLVADTMMKEVCFPITYSDTVNMTIRIHNLYCLTRDYLSTTH